MCLLGVRLDEKNRPDLTRVLSRPLVHVARRAERKISLARRDTIGARSIRPRVRDLRPPGRRGAAGCSFENPSNGDRGWLEARNVLRDWLW